MCVVRSMMSLLSCLVTMALTAAMGFSIYWFFFADENDKQAIQDIIPEDVAQQLFREEDPFVGVNTTDSWENDGTGLTLTIVNSLSNEVWYSYLDTAISQWDSGSPDSLTLQQEMGTPDFECSPIMGSMSVCNGNYGETNWKGVNNVLIDETGTIVASSAKMNEYYLPVSTNDDGTDDEKTYTMCHEVGHGFGLPHTDENFNNRDLGNCMDYTSNPSYNKQPDETNFARLAEMYLKNHSTTGSSNNTTRRSLKVPQQTIASFDDHTTQQRHKISLFRNKNINNNRMAPPTPEWILRASREIHSFLIEPNRNDHYYRQQDRVLLHKNDFGESHLFYIGNGYTIKTHLLY